MLLHPSKSATPLNPISPISSIFFGTPGLESYYQLALLQNKQRLSNLPSAPPLSTSYTALVDSILKHDYERGREPMPFIPALGRLVWSTESDAISEETSQPDKQQRFCNFPNPFQKNIDI